MRVRAISALAFATVVSAGCGAAVSSCTKAAVTTGSTTPAKIGVGTAAKGAPLLAPELFEGAARTTGRAGQAAGEAEGARLGNMSSQIKRQERLESERLGDDADVLHSPWKTVTERAQDAKDIAEGLDLLNGATDSDRERRDDRRKN